MKAIFTQYVGPSNVRGSRIIATAEGGERPHRIIVSYDHASKNPHADAALALAKKMGWKGTLIEGGRPDRKGNVYVFAEGDKYQANPIPTGLKNPAPRIGTRRASRRSQITGRAPSRRLVSRRRRNSRKGYFPNPAKLVKRHKIKYAFLVYQAGIANVFAVTSLNLADFGRDAKRLYQGDFRTAETFARGLAAAGVTVRTAAANLAGDISRAKWSEDLDAQPFSDKFRPVRENPMKRRKSRRAASPAQLRARARFSAMARSGKFKRRKKSHHYFSSSDPFARRIKRSMRRRTSRKFAGSVPPQFGSLPIIVKQGGTVVAAFQGTPEGVKRAKQYCRILARHTGAQCGVFRR